MMSRSLNTRNVPRSILLAVDDRRLGRAMAKLNRLEGSIVTVVQTVESAVERLKELRYDLLLADLRLSDGTALDLMAMLGDDLRPPLAIVMSQPGDRTRSSLGTQCFSAGFDAVILKPFGAETLAGILRGVPSRTSEWADRLIINPDRAAEFGMTRVKLFRSIVRVISGSPGPQNPRAILWSFEQPRRDRVDLGAAQATWIHSTEEYEALVPGVCRVDPEGQSLELATPIFVQRHLNPDEVAHLASQALLGISWVEPPSDLNYWRVLDLRMKSERRPRRAGVGPHPASDGGAFAGPPDGHPAESDEDRVATEIGSLLSSLAV